MDNRFSNTHSSHMIKKISEKMSIWIGIASLLLTGIYSIPIFDMYLLIYSNQKMVPTPVRTATNLDVYYNYTAIFHKDNLLKHRLSYLQANMWYGNPFDKESLGIQISIYHRFYNADVCKYGVFYPLNFTRVAYQYTTYPEPKVLKHSLIVHRKIVLGFSHHYEYGHFLTDMLCPIISMPKEITEDAEIYVNFKENQAKPYFAFLGFDPDRIHQLGDQWVHGIEVHCAVCEYGVNANYQSWNELHDMIQRKYRLYKILPTQHTVINKPKGNWGRVGNMLELFDIAKAHYPDYNWVYYPEETFYNIPLAAKIMASTNLYLSAAGSACFNCIFMHRYTHVLFFTRYITDNPAIASAITLNIYIYGLASANLSCVKVDDFVKGLDEIMHVVEHGRWKPGIENRSIMLFDKTSYEKGLNLFKDTGKKNFFKHVVKRKDNTAMYNKILGRNIVKKLDKKNRKTFLRKTISTYLSP